VFREWLNRLDDVKTRARIDARLLRARLGNLGDAKSVGGGVYELRLAFGPGYRIYFGLDGPRILVLLVGGDKGSQRADIKWAKLYWEDYNEVAHG